MSKRSLENLTKEAHEVKKEILNISHHAHVGHIGSALSIADVLTVLYNGILRVNPKKPTAAHRDRFILSKGHAAAALYVVLQRRGFFNQKKLYSFCSDNGAFGVHPEYNPQYAIELSTGSLGHGLGVGVGLALGLKQQKKKQRVQSRVYVLISDAELNEGSVWEAIMFAGHHSLDNLIVIVDDNGQQAFGKSHEVINLQPLETKWSIFNWGCRTVDGHNLSELNQALRAVPFVGNHPSVIIAKTICGKGVSFMEKEIAWHYSTLSDDLHQQALGEIDK